MSETQKPNQKRTQDLISRTLTQQVRAAQRYYDLLSRFERGEISAQAMTDEDIRFATQETGHYVSDLADLGIRFYSDLLSINQAYSNRFLNSLERKCAASTVVQSQVKRVTMDLRGPLGQEAVGAFVLENTRGGTANISFQVSDFYGPPGIAPFQGGLQFQPEHFTLEPGQEQAVTLRIELKETLFEPGQRYTASVIVLGYDNLELALTLYVDEKV